MNILYCGDRNTCTGILLSVLSLLDHSEEELHIFIFTLSYRDFTAISPVFAAKLEKIIHKKSRGSSVRLFNCTSLFEKELPSSNLDTRFTPSCMLRLYADLIEDLPERLLYLDYDVVCRGPFEDFYHQDLEGTEYVGVADYYGQWFYGHKYGAGHKYINSGVLLMNMEEIRRSGLFAKCRELCRTQKLFLPDQHALNKAASSVIVAHRRFNDQRRSHDDTVFRHYSTTFRFFPYIRTVTVKPWDTERMHSILKDYSIDKYTQTLQKEINSMQTIPVFFTIDDNYVPWLAVALRSIMDNSSKDYNYHLIILHQGLREENIKRLDSLSEGNFKVEGLPMKEKFEGIESDFIGNKLRADYFTLTIYFRLFIADMFPQYDRGIYLDSDIVVPGDLSKLYEKDLAGNYIAACPDYSIQEVPPLMDYVKEAVGVDRNLDYINSGVLLMDLAKLRELKFGTRFLEVLNKYHFDCIAPDQDYINALCKGKILYLGEEWDAMPNNTKPDLENPQIIHYNLFEKPWCYDNIRYENYFWHYAEESGFLEEIREFKSNYSEQQKASDAASMKLLVERGAMIAASEGATFKKIFNEGKERRL
ncbi:MAG: glycosyltransferase [Candidatus Cryptobacteroides sp.]